MYDYGLKIYYVLNEDTKKFMVGGRDAKYHYKYLKYRSKYLAVQ